MQCKVTCWKRNGFSQASSDANSIYKQAIQDYRVKIQEDLQQHSTSKRWWSLTKRFISIARPMSLPAHQLAEYFSSKLSEPNDVAPKRTLEDCHQSLLTQFQIKVINVRCILDSLDTIKSVGDDNIIPRVLKSCASAICGPLTVLFRKICNTAIYFLVLGDQ